MKINTMTNTIILVTTLLLSTSSRIQSVQGALLAGNVKEQEDMDFPNDFTPLRRGLQTLDPTCKVEEFELYEFLDNSPTATPVSYPWGTLDMTDRDAINIVATVTTGCQPACVKLTFAGRVQKETGAPYSLYGDTSTQGLRKGGPRLSVDGVRELKACLYTNSACTMGERGCLSRMVDVIPANTPLRRGPFALTPFALVFDNIMGPATMAQTAAAASAICFVIDEYFEFNPYYRADVGVVLFECSGSAVSGASSLTLQLTTTATVEKGTGENPYTNLRLPTRDQLSKIMKTALDSNDSMGPLCISIIEYFVQTLGDATNPYSAVTSFSIA